MIFNNFINGISSAVAAESRGGINRALINESKLGLYEKYVNENKKEGVCVFISHKSSDTSIAEYISQIFQENNIDYYLDILDSNLQNKVKEDNAHEIVTEIERALKVSTHILVIVSEDTRSSWWVPYEVGYAKSARKRIASLILNDYNIEFPDYLKIEKIYTDKNDIDEYINVVKNDIKNMSVIIE